MAFTDFTSIAQVQRLNDDNLKPVYGIVTDGEMWQFGKLAEDLFTRQKAPLTIGELKKVFGAIGHLMHANLPTAEIC